MDIVVTNYPELILADCSNVDLLLEKLRGFINSNKEAFQFRNDDAHERRAFTDTLLGIIYELASKNDNQEAICECLSSLVIMSRDVHSVHGNFSSRKTFDALIKLMSVAPQDGLDQRSASYKKRIEISACKCLCNLIFLTKDSNCFGGDGEFLKLLVGKLSDPNFDAAQEEDRNLEMLVVRLLFLVSAFNQDARTKIVIEYGGRNELVTVLNAKLSLCTPAISKSPTVRGCIEKVHAKTCCEVFKTIFNLNMKFKDEEKKILEEDSMREYETIISLCRKYLLINVVDDANLTQSLHADAQNCLYSILPFYFKDVTLVPKPLAMSDDKVFSYSGPDLPTIDGHDASAVLTILLEIERKVNVEEISTDNFVPVLSLLGMLGRSSRIIRKFCKSHVIPPRKDFVNRPEVGPKLRNKLIKLFTHANTDVKAAAADFIFVLCKENVDRLVKYTGYGNAAGLLASRGLLAGGKGSTVYSDTDSDSDTEEYREHSDEINPITGHIPPEMPDPMAGMTEEQKEYLAVQLANQLTKLSNDDVIQPVCVDPKTGKLVPFQQKVHETVLPEEKDSDDDSD